MDYVKGIFKNRPNRFIAEVEVDGKIEIAHVPNTGRCKELLVDGAAVYLKPSDNPKEKPDSLFICCKQRELSVTLLAGSQ